MPDHSALLTLFKEQLENESEGIAKDYSLTQRGDFFTWWYFLRILNLDDSEIMQIVCDGGGDLGIDAVRIDEDNFVHFYQFKNPNSMDSAFPEGDIDKVLGGLDLILSGDYQRIASEELKGRIQEIYKSVRNGYFLHIVTSGTGLSKEARTKVENFKTQLRGPSDDFFRWQLEDLPFIQDAFYRKNLPTVQDPINLELSQTPYQIRSADNDCYLFHLSGSDLAALYNKFGEQLLQQNIRIYQGDKGTNDSIMKTCTSEDSGNFLHYNNGVTFLCETAQWDGFTRKLTMEHVQIVNGGQTVRVLSKAKLEGKLKPDVLIPTRILTSQGNKEFANNVAVNLNNQNRILPSYLRSNDPRVVQLATSLASLGWYLERREKEVASLTNDEKIKIEQNIGRPLDGHVIKLKEGTQAYVSTYMREPELAKKNPKLMFLSSQDAGFFERIFNRELTAEKFISATRLFWQVTLFAKSFMTRKRRRNRVEDWRTDYETLLGKSLVSKYGEVVDQVIPQSVVFLSAIMFEIEVNLLGRSIDDLISELAAENYSNTNQYLEKIIQFASEDKDNTSSWPTLLKSQAFYDRFSSYFKGLKNK